jgi:ribose transport system permease protein
MNGRGVLTQGLALGRSAPRLSVLRDYGIIGAFVVLFVALSLTSGVFLSVTNITNILDQWSSVAVMACGMTLVFIAGGFDISVGAIYALVGVISAKLAGHIGPYPALLIGVLAGLICGSINGLLITAGRINAFVATLATSIIYTGVAVVITGGFLITVADPAFQTVGSGSLFGVAKYTIIIFALTVLCTMVVLHRSTFGRYLYACGGNAAAAALSGIRVNVIRAVAFGLVGLSAGIGGAMDVSRTGTGESTSGQNLALTVIAAVVIGGTSLYGGAGAIWRSVLGVLLLALIGNGFVLLGVDPTYQQMIYGAIILTAVGLDAWTRKRDFT